MSKNPYLKGENDMTHLIAKLIIGGVAVLIFGSAALAGICWVVERFAKKAAVKARARQLKEFSIAVNRTTLSVARTTLDVVNLDATANGTIFYTEQMSYSDYPQQMERNEPIYYNCKT